MAAVGSPSTTWCVWIFGTQERGLCGSISRFCCKHRGACCPVTAPTNCVGQPKPLHIPRSQVSTMLRIGVVGYGYWGRNIVRNLRSLQGSPVARACDQSPAAMRRIKQAHPDLNVTTNCSELLESKEIDAVAVVTPVCTPFDLAKAALQNGKHVFVEKPFTATVRQAEELVELAERKNLKIMVDHTFLFTGAVRKIRELIDEGVLGDLYYYDSTRVNLGLFQHDVSVIWDLAPHD